jgi:hypothetical protein
VTHPNAATKPTTAATAATTTVVADVKTKPAPCKVEAAPTVTVVKAAAASDSKGKGSSSSKTAVPAAVKQSALKHTGVYRFSTLAQDDASKRLYVTLDASSGAAVSARALAKNNLNERQEDRQRWRLHKTAVNGVFTVESLGSSLGDARWLNWCAETGRLVAHTLRKTSKPMHFAFASAKGGGYTITMATKAPAHSVQCSSAANRVHFALSSENSSKAGWTAEWAPVWNGKFGHGTSSAKAAAAESKTTSLRQFSSPALLPSGMLSANLAFPVLKAELPSFAGVLDTTQTRVQHVVRLNVTQPGNRTTYFVLTHGGGKAGGFVVLVAVYAQHVRRHMIRSTHDDKAKHVGKVLWFERLDAKHACGVVCPTPGNIAQLNGGSVLAIASGNGPVLVYDCSIPGTLAPAASAPCLGGIDAKGATSVAGCVASDGYSYLVASSAAGGNAYSRTRTPLDKTSWEPLRDSTPQCKLDSATGQMLFCAMPEVGIETPRLWYRSSDTGNLRELILAADGSAAAGKLRIVCGRAGAVYRRRFDESYDCVAANGSWYVNEVNGAVTAYGIDDDPSSSEFLFRQFCQ